MTFKRIELDFEQEGHIARIALAAPKANILDCEMMAELSLALQMCTEYPLHGIVIGARGPHFSFGASVPEHLPDRISGTLNVLHALLRRLVTAPAPTIAAIHGQCLGGAFELALACDLIIAEEDSVVACPEVKLGVFAPAASALLPVQVGSAQALRLLLTGAKLSAQDAMLCGLVSQVAPRGGLEAALSSYVRENLLTTPTITLRCAAEAARWAKHYALHERLPALEKLYLGELMSFPEPLEGLRAFIEKREPEWHLQIH